jgi:myo-inositol-hexaphosphate 3-phosphohydrolase
LIHTAQSGTAGIDEIWIYATNPTASAVVLTIEYGGVLTADQIKVTIASQAGLTTVVPGLALNNAQVVRAFGATASAINISGFVNRIT